MKSVNDIEKLQRKNNNVGLSEEVRMTDAVSDYVKKSRDYLEYLHWNNSNCLNGFIDHDKNIYVMNDEYYGRKSICDQIYDKYKTYDFVWTNQSCIYRFP